MLVVQCAQFLGLAQLQLLIVRYSLDCESLRMEPVLAKHTLAKKTMESIADVFQELSPLREAFPTLLKLLQIALTICVTCASCERSFFSLKPIRTYPRSTMHEESLVNLAVLSVEQEISQTLNLENIDKFCTQDTNRIVFLFF